MIPPIYNLNAIYFIKIYVFDYIIAEIYNGGKYMGGRITMKKTDYRVERDSIGVKDIGRCILWSTILTCG